MSVSEGGGGSTYVNMRTTYVAYLPFGDTSSSKRVRRGGCDVGSRRCNVRLARASLSFETLGG